jgi:superfamily II DNA/RNA helicase
LEPTKKFLIFTQYKDTQKAIKEFLKDKVRDEGISFVESGTKTKEKILKEFNDPQGNLRILVTTDTLSEGYNISGADTVVNFDIPFNPVRLIQRIGRATMLHS